MPLEIETTKQRTPGKQLRLFSVYTDSFAAANERWAASQIKALTGESDLRHCGRWDLDILLVSEHMKRTAAKAAAGADILLISIGSLELRETSLVHWLDSVACADPDGNAPRLIIGLLGSEKAKATELDWNVKQLIRCTKAMNSAFIWHWMGEDASVDVDFLTEHIADLLATKQSTLPELTTV
jgi:hypothetical protein